MGQHKSVCGWFAVYVLADEAATHSVAGTGSLERFELEMTEKPGNSSPHPHVESLHAVNTEDQQLIDECLAGQTDAFGQLVVRYQDRLYNTLVNVLGSADEARDVAQEAFVHAFQKLATFRGQAAFYSWLFRIALNAAISQKRKRRRMSASIDRAHDQTGIEPADPRDDNQPSYSMELAERQALVRTALSQISEEYRTVLVLKEMDGLKYEQIAEIVGCPIGTVRSRIHRARTELRTKLKILFQHE
jgi:RNA polymerase sigma-70 factor (ECF subfamily)